MSLSLLTSCSLSSLPAGRVLGGFRVGAGAPPAPVGWPLQNLSTTNAVKSFGGDAAVWPRKFISDGLAAFERALDGDGAFSCGETPTIADCCLVPQLASARRFGVDPAQFPRLLAIEERCLALPAFANAAPDKQPDAVRLS